jgi:hypothetical protein
LSADAADIGVYHDVDQRHWEVLFLRRIERLFSTQLSEGKNSTSISFENSNVVARTQRKFIKHVDVSHVLQMFIQDRN